MDSTGEALGLAFYLFILTACTIIINKKDRGFGYIAIAIFFPLIGLIVAICLSPKRPQQPEAQLNESPPLLPPNENISVTFIKGPESDYNKSNSGLISGWDDLPSLNSDDEFI